MMAVWPSDYIENVLDDIEKYNDVRKIIKAGLIERHTVKYCAPEHLHPNPADEFSQADIGPNMEIVGNYVKQIQHDLKHQLQIFEEAVIVQKMEPDGYMLLNGHHRWFAALRMRINKLHIQIVNLINESDMHRMITGSDNMKLVSFDFDEVLLSADESNQAAITSGLFSNKYKERLREGAPELIKYFQDKGYDVCVYTAGYFTEEDFNDFFSMYGLDINIVANGINEKRKKVDEEHKRIKELLRDRYKQIVHVDNESAVCTNHITKDYEIYEIADKSLSWKDGIKGIIDNMN